MSCLPTLYVLMLFVFCCCCWCAPFWKHIFFSGVSFMFCSFVHVASLTFGSDVYCRHLFYIRKFTLSIWDFLPFSFGFHWYVRLKIGVHSIYTQTLLSVKFIISSMTEIEELLSIHIHDRVCWYMKMTYFTILILWNLCASNFFTSDWFNRNCVCSHITSYSERVTWEKRSQFYPCSQS